MDPRSNPFSPGAGTQPPELTGREENLSRAELVLVRIKGGKVDRSSLLIGLRGVGKTVLLNQIQQLAEKEGYHAVLTEAPENQTLAGILVPPLRQILLRIDRVKGVKEKLRDAFAALRSFAGLFEVKIGDDIGIGIKPPAGVADSGVLDRDLTDLLVSVGEAAKEASTAVAIIIDELQYVKQKELGALIAGIHRVNQLSLPLVIFGAGLPQLAGLTGKAKSYAERLFEFQTIDRLSDEDAKKAIKIPLQEAGVFIEEAALDEIVKVTEGYPYFLQEWGKHVWDRAQNSPITLSDVHEANASAIKALDESFFRVRFDRMTPGEKEYLRAMADLGKGSHRSGEIAKKLKRGVEEVAPTRGKIISKGMIYAPAHGDNAFTVPKFDEYMLRVIPNFVPTPAKRKRHRKK